MIHFTVIWSRVLVPSPSTFPLFWTSYHFYRYVKTLPHSTFRLLSCPYLFPFIYYCFSFPWTLLSVEVTSYFNFVPFSYYTLRLFRLLFSHFGGFYQFFLLFLLFQNPLRLLNCDAIIVTFVCLLLFTNLRCFFYLLLFELLLKKNSTYSTLFVDTYGFSLCTVVTNEITI